MVRSNILDICSIWASGYMHENSIAQTLLRKIYDSWFHEAIIFPFVFIKQYIRANDDLV